MLKLNIKPQDMCKLEVIGGRYTQKDFDEFDVRNAKKCRSNEEGADLRIIKLRFSNNWWAYLSNSILSF
jgi:hypothetical protein